MEGIGGSFSCRFSVIDVINLVNPGRAVDYGANKWGVMSTESQFQGRDFDTHQFLGQRQRKTPVATMDGVLAVVDYFDTPVARQLKAPQREIFMQVMRGELTNAEPCRQPSSNPRESQITSEVAESQRLMASAMQQISETVSVAVGILRDDKLRADDEVREVRAKAEDEVREVRAKAKDEIREVCAKAEDEIRASKRKADECLSEMHEAKRHAAVLETRLNMVTKDNEVRVAVLYKELADKEATMGISHKQLEEMRQNLSEISSEKERAEKQNIELMRRVEEKTQQCELLSDDAKMLRDHNLVSGRNIVARYTSINDRVRIASIRSAIEAKYRQRNGRSPLKVEFDYNGGTFTDEMYSMKEVAIWIRNEVSAHDI